MTDEEIRAEIKKRGGYASYRASEISRDQDVYHHDGKVWEYLAKTKGLTVEEYFRRYPNEYRDYRRATSVRIGTRVAPTIEPPDAWAELEDGSFLSGTK